MEQENSLPTREKILFAAIELFAGKGYGNVSMREIAGKVGIKASSLYKHYDGKEALLESIFDLFRHKFSETNLPTPDLRQYLKTITPLEYLNRAFELFRQIMWTPVIVNISKIITTEQQRNRPVRQFFMEELINKPHRMMKHVFDIMKENGSICDIDTAAAAEEYNSYIIFLYFELNFLKEGPDIEEIDRRMKQHNEFFANYVLKQRSR